ncbi:MAG: Tad domain-containing protein [bacterium]|nr:Tad domain-containing protein [bacterium]
MHRAAVGSDHHRRSRKPNNDSRVCISGGPPSKRKPVVVYQRRSNRRSGPTPAPRHRQRGQVTVMFVVLTVALVMLGGLAFDGAQILNARRKASTLALETARAGAQAISIESLYPKPATVLVDSSKAQIAASDYLGQHDDWSISVRSDTVSATVWLTQPLQILSFLGMDSRRVAGTATARAVQGIRTGDDL